MVGSKIEKKSLRDDSLALVTDVTNLGTFRTTTQRTNQSTCLTLEDVLIDVFGTRPREGAGVVTT